MARVTSFQISETEDDTYLLTLSLTGYLELFPLLHFSNAIGENTIPSPFENSKSTGMAADSKLPIDIGDARLTGSEVVSKPNGELIMVINFVLIAP